MEQILAQSPKNLDYQTVKQVKWQRIILLSILGYEGLGALTGGFLLILAPDGRYMQMPVEIMHGSFKDFLLPGIILFALGMLTTAAFFSVLRRSSSDWLMAGLSLSGLHVWFVVEIIILEELHWLHAMWGTPVLLGWVVLTPLIALRHKAEPIQKIFLSCGILSSLWYFVINILVPLQDTNYSSVTQTISELSAFGAPTRVTWVLLATIYPLLYAAFGWGLLQYPGRNRYLRITGILTIIYCVFNFYWPPMHQREVLAAGGGTLSDTLHITWAMFTLLFNILIMGFGAAALGKRFRIYTLTSFIFFILFGILIGIEAPGISSNLPTPGIGIWERLNIAVYMIWVIVLAIILLRKQDLNSGTR